MREINMPRRLSRHDGASRCGSRQKQYRGRW